MFTSVLCIAAFHAAAAPLTRAPPRNRQVHIISMENGSFEGALHDIGVQGSAGLAEEWRQAIPVPKGVVDRRAHAGVGPDFLLLELGAEPRVQFVHDRAAVRLVKAQPFLR